MILIETLWWLLFWTAFGLCVGSFLNVVIHRIPHGLSIRNPIWSFCPSCRSRIRWYDNLPLISYLRLGGRCRDCDTSIAIRYPLTEAAMAVVVLVLLDAFFIAQTHAGWNRDALGLTWKLADDWPIFLAHVILFACLLAMSAIDIEYYWIDTAIARVAVVAGFVLHALWTPYHGLTGGDGPAGLTRPWDTTAAACLAALIGLGLVGGVCRLMGWSGEPETGADGSPHSHQESTSERRSAGSGAPSGPVPAPDALESERSAPERTRPDAFTAPRRGLLWTQALGLALVGLVVVLILAGVGSSWAVPVWIRLGAVPAAFFILIVARGSVPRPADQEILESIDAERPWARKTALQELAFLSPAIVLAAAALFTVRRSEGASVWFSSLLDWQPIGAWQPLWGVAAAATGYVIAAGIGWSVRIGATLIYGREAFGDGDIHMMAAAGCVAGWPVVVLGFVIACLLALAGWVLALPFKRTRAIPLVPWLSLSFLVAVVFYDQLLQLQPVENVIYVTKRLLFDNSQGLSVGGLP